MGSSFELRFFQIGRSELGRILAMSYTERGEQIRIIAQEPQPFPKGENMTEQEELEYEMPDEINFSIGRPNPYTAPAKGRVVNVQVERELYNLFASDEAVSEALRNYAEARKEAA